jgi:hypothetical protein
MLIPNRDVFAVNQKMKPELSGELRICRIFAPFAFFVPFA